MDDRRAFNAAALSNMVNGPGWRIAMVEAETAIREIEQQALACEDPAKIPYMNAKAKGARDFVRVWKQRLESSRTLSAPSEIVDVALM